MNIDTFRKKTGLKYKEAAKALGVNPVTLTRWKQKWGGEIPKEYSDKVQKALQGKKKNSTLKAPPKVVMKRKDSAPKEGSELKELTLLDFYNWLKKENHPVLNKIKEQVEDFIQGQIKKE